MKQLMLDDAIIEDVKVNLQFELKQCFCSCGTEQGSCGPDCYNYGKNSDEDITTIEVLITLNKDGKRKELRVLGRDAFWRSLE